MARSAPLRAAGFGAFLALTSAALAARADVPVWRASDEPNAPNVVLTGYVQPGVLWRQNDPDPGQPNPNQDDGFLLQRARFGLRSRLHPWMSIRLEYDATTSSLTDAFLDITPHRALSIRFGQFLLPFLQTYRFSEDSLAFIDRPLYLPLAGDRQALRYLNPRDVGVRIGGRAFGGESAPTAPVFEYAAGMFQGQGPNATNNIDDAYLYAIRAQLHLRGVPGGEGAESDLARSPTPRIALGGAVYTNCDDRGQWNRGFTGDLELRYAGLYASGSFLWFQNGASSGLGNFLGYDGTTDSAGTPVKPGCGTKRPDPPPTHRASGLAIQVQYVLPKILPEGAGSFEVLTRFDQVNPESPCPGGHCSFLGGGPSSRGYTQPASYADGDSPPTRWRASLGVNWFPDDRQILRFSLNYFLNREAETVVNASGTYHAIKNDVLWFQATAGF